MLKVTQPSGVRLHSPVCPGNTLSKVSSLLSAEEHCPAGKAIQEEVALLGPNLAMGVKGRH